MLAAVAEAAGVPSAAVRRAQTLAGDLGAVAVAALDSGRRGPGRVRAHRRVAAGADAGRLRADRGRGARSGPAPAGVEWKLDGIRVQLHRDGDEVRIFTRSLDEVTDRMPEVVAAVLAGVPDRSSLDGEVLALRPDGRPRPFQETGVAHGHAARTRSPGRATTPLTLFVFDALHLAGRDVLDQPGALRRNALRDQVSAEPAGAPAGRHRPDRPGPGRGRRGVRGRRPRARPRGRRRQVRRLAVRHGPARGRAGSRSSRCTRSTWWSWPPSGAMAGAPASCPTCISARSTRTAGSGRRAAS